MKITKISRDGDYFTMTVKHADKHRENWIYVRESAGGLTSFSMVGREDA